MQGNDVAGSGDHALEIDLVRFHWTAKGNDFASLGSSQLRQPELGKRHMGAIRQFQHQ